MTPLEKALIVCQKVLNRTGRGPRPQHDWEKIVRYWFDCKNQHLVAEKFGLHQSGVSKILLKCGISVGKGKNSFPVIDLPIEIVSARYLAGESTIEIARTYNIDPEIVRNRLERNGIKRRPAGPPSGAKNPQWKGGGRKPTMHYHRRQAYEVAAICLGQPLPQGWVIHHSDENPMNNEPKNLLIFQSLSDHTSFHQLLLENQRKDPTIDAIQLALKNGATALPLPPSPLIIPPCKDRPAPSKKKQKPASIRTRSKLGQWTADQQ